MDNWGPIFAVGTSYTYGKGVGFNFWANNPGDSSDPDYQWYLAGNLTGGTCSYNSGNTNTGGNCIYDEGTQRNADLVGGSGAGNACPTRRRDSRPRPDPSQSRSLTEECGALLGAA